MKLTLLYWQDGDWWIGHLAEYPEIMTQGRSQKELEGNIQDAWLQMRAAGWKPARTVSTQEVTLAE